MTGCAPAALAAIRAALGDANRLGHFTTEDVAQHVIDELARDGWRITPATDDQ